MAAYLLAWLLSYHGLRTPRVGGASRGMEGPTLARGRGTRMPGRGRFVAALSHRSGILGDVSLALPIAWSLPELIDSLMRRWSYTTVAIPIAAPAV